MNNLINALNINNGDFIPERYLVLKTGKIPSMYTIYLNDSPELDLQVLFKNKEIDSNLDKKFDLTILFCNSYKSLRKTSAIPEDDFDVSAKKNVSYMVLANEHMIIEIFISKFVFYYDSSVYTHYEIVEFSEHLLKLFPTKKEERKPAKVRLVIHSGYYDSIESSIKNTIVDIKKNYNDDFELAYKKLTKFIGQRESGIALLSGVPGTGKTTICRHLITSFPANYLFITPSVAMNMGNPDFVSFLMENKDSIFIMEDCEQLLQERTTNSWSTSLANILNMTDGILSDIFNIKFICTFNAPETTIDPALLREGRCFVNYKFDKLKADKVAILNKENNLGIPDNEICDMTLAELYNYQGKKEIKKKIGF